MNYLLLLILFLTYNFPLFPQSRLYDEIDQQNIYRIGKEFKSPVKVNKALIFSDEFKSFNLSYNANATYNIVNLNDSYSSIINLPQKESWLVVKIELKGFYLLDKELRINIKNTGSVSSVYWNDSLVWQRNERGKSDHDRSTGIKIPHDKIENGYYNLVMKLDKNTDNSVLLPAGVQIGLEEHFIESRIRDEYLKIFLMAILLTSGLFYIILFFGFNKNITYLIFSAYCFLNSFGVFENLPWLILSNTGVIEPAGGVFSFIIYIITCFTMIVFFLTKYSFYKTNRILSLVAIAAPLVFLLFQETYYVIAIYSFALIINLFALYRKKEGASFILIGLAGFIILFYIQICYSLSNGYFFGSLFFILFVSILSSREIAVQVKNHRQAVLRTSRLENELLKRNIHPHFIMNTLMSLQEVVEQNPDKASSFIQALAEEFQMFSKISGEALVSVEDEFRICRAHLQIMEFRKEARFELQITGFNGTEKIPPGIFHTLIENGTTHGYLNKKEGLFSITKNNYPGFTRYTVFNDSENGNVNEELIKGTGIKYIEARLEESFHGLWKLSYNMKNGGFEVVIDVYETKVN